MLNILKVPRLSIIVPIYNASRSLTDCLKSILTQSFSDFELILINDGSTDDSCAICEKLAILDHRIKLISKQNEGVSIARNVGLDLSIGENILFLDSDDSLLPGALDGLMKCHKENLVVGGVLHVLASSKIEFFNVPHTGVYFLNKDAENIQDILCQVYFTAPWSKLYRKEIIEKNHLRFRSDLFYGEDTDFVYRYLIHIDSFVTINKAVTKYIDSQTVLHKKYKMTFEQFQTLNSTIQYNIHELSKKMGCKLGSVQSFHDNHESEVYFESLLHCSSLDSFRQEIKGIKHQPDILNATSKKKKLIKKFMLIYPSLAFLIISFYNLLRNMK